MRQTLAEITGQDSRAYPDNHSGTTSVHTLRSEEQLRETVLECIAHAALWRVLRKSRFDDGSPLVQFFRSDLGGEWAAFIEASKELAELVIDGSRMERISVWTKRRNASNRFVNPFYRF